MQWDCRRGWSASVKRRKLDIKLSHDLSSAKMASEGNRVVVLISGSGKLKASHIFIILLTRKDTRNKSSSSDRCPRDLITP